MSYRAFQEEAAGIPLGLLNLLAVGPNLLFFFFSSSPSPRSSQVSSLTSIGASCRVGPRTEAFAVGI